MPDLPTPLRVVRPQDLLVLDLEFLNLRLSDDGAQLERVDAGAGSHIIIRLPGQHVAEQVYFETENSIQPADAPPVAAFAAASSRLVFSLPNGVARIPFSLASVLDWAALTARLPANALPPGAQDGPASGVPAADQTAIEFPYRLLLSPDQSAHWQHRSTPFGADRRTELWHTRLVSDQPTVPLRAVGRRSVRDTFRMALSDPDLDEIVLLSSNFSVRPLSWIELGMPYIQWRQRLQAARLFGFHYVPVPLQAERLMLTPLGANARLRGQWNYPAPDQDPDVLRSFGMPAPSLEQYEHIAGLGRDQYVRVVRRGLVHPGVRASIVKITERRFEPRQIRTEQTPAGAVGIFGARAYLRQYFKIVIQEPEIRYADLAAAYQFGGREMPLRSFRLTTLETPKIDLPNNVSPDAIETQVRLAYIAAHPGRPIDDAAERAIAREAQRQLEAAFKQPFWIRVANQDFEFGYVAHDWEGQTITGSVPLVFVPYEAVTHTSDVLTTFNAGDNGRRRRPLRNQQLALADPTGSAPASTRAPTETVTFSLQTVAASRVGALPATYLPRWLMAIAGAEVHLESVERLTNTNAAVAMTFDPTYLAAGLAANANPAGVFASVAQVKVGFGGARGGGIARPDASVDRISSRQGAMSSTFAKPSVQAADLATLFGGAKFFGTFDLKDILAALGPVNADHFSRADLPENALRDLLNDPGRLLEIPVLRTRPLLRDGRPYAVETRFVWKPRLEAKSLFLFRTGQSQLVLDARTVTPLDGGAATSEIRGELRNFGMSFAGVVTVRLERLAFVTLPGRKPDVTAEGLDVEFDGPLQFVNSLRNILPPSGFSDPPAIEVTPSGISAGFSLGIPSVGVGVFSLQNLALSAALSVPFVAKPAGVRFAISERHHPFLVSVTLFGGGGFFALGVSANGVEEIEAAIEFGGNISINLGVASGGVYVMAGIYFGRTASVCTLTGYLRCGGYLSVLGLITISIEFYLAFTYRAKDGAGSEVWGQASVKVCVEVACFSKSVTLSMERRFAGAGGDPTLEDVVDPDDWEIYCRAFAAEAAA